MRKLSFYSKLAAGNLWRNKTTYTPYLLACITCIATFYTLMAIQYSGSLSQLRGSYIVEAFVIIGSVLLGIFCTILLFWTNSFLVKRRKKELALYSVLGMEKRNIALLMFFETLFVAAIALVIGLGAGALVARLLYLLLLRLIQYEVMVTLPISMTAIVSTAIFFAAIFGLTLLSNLRQVRLANPMEMMAGARQGEKEPKSSIILTIAGLICLGIGYAMAIIIQTPVEALLLFLVAALFVIIGTYCLFTSGSIALLKAMRKKKSFYYKPNHFISISGMIYRMKQNAAGLATICILSCMVLVTMSSTIGLYTGMEDSLAQSYPNDYEIRPSSREDTELVRQNVSQIAREYNIRIEDEKVYNYFYFPVQKTENSLTIPEDGYLETVLYVVSQDDYIRNEGIDPELQNGQALLYDTSGNTQDGTMGILDREYSIQVLDDFKFLSSGTYSGDCYILVLPDNDIAWITETATALYGSLTDNEDIVYQSRYQLSFEAIGTDEARAEFRAAVEEQLPHMGLSSTYHYTLFDEMKEEFYAMNGGFLFLGIFFGVLFLFAAAMIIYYKQLSEGYDDRERFDILQKVGMSEGEVRHTIMSQVRAVFFLPLGVAVLHICVAIIPVRAAMLLLGLNNFGLLVISFSVTILVYALVYLLVYRRTAKTYFKIIRRAM